MSSSWISVCPASTGSMSSGASGGGARYRSSSCRSGSGRPTRWGPAYERETNYLRSYMATIRRKLEPNPSQPRYFRTEPGVGVRFVPGGSDGGDRPPKPEPSDGGEDRLSG